MTTVEQGFVKGQSDNLPKLDNLSMFSFLGNHPDFMGVEMKGVKLNRSGRENYGDNAIGYVQVKRDGNICTVKARVTPEHSIHKKAYSVSLVCDEQEEEIISVKCEDCVASSGGCKHAIALLTWIHRRSEDPPFTSAECYWKKSKLSNVGTQVKLLKGKDMKKKRSSQDLNSNYDADILPHMIEGSLRHGYAAFSKYWKSPSAVEKLSMHHLFSEFFQNRVGQTAEHFLRFCSFNISNENCEKAYRETMGQGKNAFWYELRYARVTASRVHEASHCKTYEGVLVEGVLGAYTLQDNKEMKRGRELEEAVRKQIERNQNIKLDICGLMISSEYPLIGASADAINDEFVVEIKCPTSEKRIKNYVNNDVIKDKYMAQLQLQMYVHKKKRGMFCIADPNFEKNKSLQILIAHIDEDYCKNLIEKSTEFWKKAVFPFIKKNFD